MGDRTVLGAADVSDAELTGLVARQLGVPADAVAGVTSVAEVAPYDLEAPDDGRPVLGARHGVGRRRGAAIPVLRQARAVVRPLTDLRAWSRRRCRSRPNAVAAVADRAAGLPVRPGRAAARRPDHAARRTASTSWTRSRRRSGWRPCPRSRPIWDIERFAHAAYLLGRLAASPAVRPLADLGRRHPERTIRGYVEGRIVSRRAARAARPGLWQHPLVAGRSTSRCGLGCCRPPTRCGRRR